VSKGDTTAPVSSRSRWRARWWRIRDCSILPPRPRWWKATEERDRRALEENRKQIAEAEERMRAHEEREAAEARKAQEADRAAYYAEHGWPT
jgi:hypothetical protein